MTTEAPPNVLQLSFEDAELVKFSDAVIERVSQLVAHKLKRRRDELLCERDGHVWDSRALEVYELHYCERCGYHIEELPTR